jgi:hypothetical protein
MRFVSAGFLKKLCKFWVAAPFARGLVSEVAADSVDVSGSGGPLAGVGGAQHRDCGWKRTGHIGAQIVA